MDFLKKKFHQKSIALKQQFKQLSRDHGDIIVAQVSLNQILRGARGIPMMFWDISSLDPVEGIRFRGYSISELIKLLPTAQGDTEPLPEGLFWLMMTGEIPTKKEVQWLGQQWSNRAKVPDHTYNLILALPKDTHPMTQFSLAITSMQTESVFTKQYNSGLSKKDYWDATYEDTMNLIACLPLVAAFIYRKSFHGDRPKKPDVSLDWAANFAQMLGFDDLGLKRLMRLYMTIHADHEGGNASAHATHLIGSTLSDPYLSLAAGMNALAGPLHGLANQESVKWILQMLEVLQTGSPTSKQIEDYVHETLSKGRVIPGYGHGVLRVTDPRFIVQQRFAEKYLSDAPLVQVVWKIYEVVPRMLESLGKVKNPYPNVDAHSGALLVHYGLTEFQFYTVLFGVSRALGVLSALCWSRALGLAIERPKSVTFNWIKEKVAVAKV